MNENLMKEYNLILVDEIDMGDIYSWTQMDVYFSKEKNRFFWVSGEGCSCEWLYSDVRTLADMCDGDRKAAARAVRSFAEANRSNYYGDIAVAGKAVLSFKI